MDAFGLRSVSEGDGVVDDGIGVVEDGVGKSFGSEPELFPVEDANDRVLYLLHIMMRVCVAVVCVDVFLVVPFCPDER